MSNALAGEGTTIEFLTSGFEANVDVDTLSVSSIARETIDVTHLGTPKADSANGEYGSKQYIPSTHVDPGEISCDIFFNPDKIPPVEGDPEQVRVTFPPPQGKDNGATIQGLAFITGFDIQVAKSDAIKASLTVKFTGPVTVTASSNNP